MWSKSGRTRFQIDRIQGRLRTDIKAIALRTAEADVRHQFADGNGTEVRAVRRIAKHIATGRRPDVAVTVATKSVEASVRTCREGSPLANRKTVRADAIGMHG